MVEEPNSSIEARIERIKYWYALNGIDKHKWMEMTGYSERQWYSWHDPNGSSPKPDQIVTMYAQLDISPLWAWWGIGPQRVSDLQKMFEEDDYHKFQKAYLEKLDTSLNRIVEILEKTLTNSARR